MTDYAPEEQAGWVVRVIAPERIGFDAPEFEIWDVAMSDPNDAVKTVSERIRAIHETVEAVQELAPATIRGFGLKRGDAKQRL
jgi:hypothetical protein